MKRIPSHEFRKTYPRITEPVAVTALGRVIGTWTPIGTPTTTVTRDAWTMVPDGSEPKAGAMSQKDRDAILRKVAKS